LRTQRNSLNHAARLACVLCLPLLASGCRLRGAVKEVYVSQHLNAGVAALQSGKTREAATELERVLEVEPDHLEARELLLTTLLQNKQYDEVIQVLGKRPPADRTVQDLFLLADASDKAGRVNDAETFYREAVERAKGTPQYPVALNNFGYMLANHGRNLPESLRLLTEADRLMPNQGTIVDSLSWVYYRLGDHQRALTEIDRACRLAPTNGDLHYHRGMILLGLGKEADAARAFRLATVLDPHNKEAATQLQRRGGTARRPASVAGGPKKPWEKAAQTLKDLVERARRELF